MLAELVDPTILAGLSADLGRVILVVGTNGKTTTARLTARIIAGVDGRRPIANRSGANLRQGLTSTLVAEASLHGGLRTPGRTAVFEVDELALPAVLDAVRPAALVITNLFRDQLDRYGEVDTGHRSMATCAGRPSCDDGRRCLRRRPPGRPPRPRLRATDDPVRPGPGVAWGGRLA
jgi:UDP-N-acetylmuramyl tripeptide synthase